MNDETQKIHKALDDGESVSNWKEYWGNTISDLVASHVMRMGENHI